MVAQSLLTEMNPEDPILLKAKYVFSWTSLGHFFFSQVDRCGETKGVTITTVPSWLS